MTAQQAYFTSSATGLSRYPGFQFVARSSGLRDADADAVARYLVYGAPPNTPPEPEPDTVERLPIAFGYIRTAAGPTLTCCRYAGRDYAGRPGNYFAHAVLAEPEDLGAIRPIEFWRAPFWAARTATDEPHLPVLDDLTPGDVIDPDAVEAAIISRGEAGYRLLSLLIDGATQVIDEGSKRLILIGDDVDDIALWIAAVSYSLPAAAATELSFLTYSADPERTDHRIVGTTPDVRLSSASAGQRIDLTCPPSDVSYRPSVFASAIAQCWRDRDLFRIDSICDMVGLTLESEVPVESVDRHAEDRDAACLLALACDGVDIPDDQVPAVAQLVRRRARVLPPPVWTALCSGRIRDFEIRLSGWRAAGTAGRTDDADLIGSSCVIEAIGNRTLRMRLPEGGRLSFIARGSARAHLTAAAERSTTLREVVEICEMARHLDVLLDFQDVQQAATRATTIDPGGVRECRASVPDKYLNPFRLGVLGGLNQSPVALIAATLDRTTCDWFGTQDWQSYPRLGRRVLVLQGEKRTGQRVATVRHMLALSTVEPLGGGELNDALLLLWGGRDPSVSEREGLLDLAVAARPEPQATIALFVAGHWRRQAVRSEREYRLAERLWNILRRKPTTRLTADLGLAMALYQLSQRRPLTIPHFESLAQYADKQLADFVINGAVDAINRMPPGEKAVVVSTLGRAATNGVADRVCKRLVQMPLVDPKAIARLAHFAMVLHHHGCPDRTVDEYLARLLSGRYAKVIKALSRMDKLAADTLAIVLPEDQYR